MSMGWQSGGEESCCVTLGLNDDGQACSTGEDGSTACRRQSVRIWLENQLVLPTLRKHQQQRRRKDKKRKDVSLFQSFFDLSQKKQRAAVLTTPLPPVATAAVVGFGATYGASS